MKVAVIGAGIAGCCAALALAERGQHCVLIDAQARPMQEASRWNEGKLHLGYVYASDQTLATARTMIGGSLSFLQTLQGLTGRPLPERAFSRPFIYAVPRDSQRPPEAIARHFQRVDALIEHARLSRGDTRFPAWPLPPARQTAVEPHFDGSEVSAAFETAEFALDPHLVADMVTEAVLQHPRVEFIGSTTVQSIDNSDERAHLHFHSYPGVHTFDWVINASWRSLLALDAAAGFHTGAPRMYRYKLSLQSTAPCTATLPSATLVLGPYGDVVSYASGRHYLSWYPSCRIASSFDTAHPTSPASRTPQTDANAARDALQALARRLPALTALEQHGWQIDGGWILAAATSDIDDPDSGLHARHAIGVRRLGRVVSIDSGKYCTAPGFALQAATHVLANA